MNRYIVCMISLAILCGCKGSEFFNKQNESVVASYSETGMVINEVSNPPENCSEIKSLELCESANGCQPLFDNSPSDLQFLSCIVAPPVANSPAVNIPASCSDVDSQFLVNVGQIQKVIICHNANKKSHSITIACPALSSHQNHHEDKVGACSESDLNP
jgi:hypothetical protein